MKLYFLSIFLTTALCLNVEPLKYKGFDYYANASKTYLEAEKWCKDQYSSSPLLRYERTPNSLYSQLQNYIGGKNLYFYIETPVQGDDGNYYFGNPDGDSILVSSVLTNTQEIPNQIDCVKLRIDKSQHDFEFNNCTIRADAVCQKDINECTMQLHLCKFNTTCFNIWGNYQCRCLSSKVGPGRPCKPYCHEDDYSDYSYPDTLGNFISYATLNCPQRYPKVFQRCVTKEIDGGYSVAERERSVTTKCGEDYAGQASAVKNPQMLENTCGGLQTQTQPSNLDLENVTELQFNTEIIGRSIEEYEFEISENAAAYAAALFSNVASSLSKLNESRLFNTSGTSPISTFDVYLNNVNRTARNILTINSEFISLQLLDHTDKFKNLTFSPQVYLGESKFDVPVKLTLPSEIFMSIDDVPTTVMALYKESYLFNSVQKPDWVVSATLGKNNPVNNLTNPVVIEFRNETRKHKKLEPRNLTVDLVNMECVFWDMQKEEWSIEGCCLDTEKTPAYCKCTHLTNFAVLVSIIELPADRSMSLYSQIGCGCSILGYVLVIFIFVRNKNTFEKLPTKMQIHLFVNLLVAYCIFEFGIDKVEDKTTCLIITGFLHYFLLTSWLWMAIYSRFLYESIVSVVDIGRINAKAYLLKCSMFAYGISLFVVALNIGLTTGYFDEMLKNKALCDPDADPLVRSYYLSDHICWITSYSLYIFLGIVGLIILFNLFVVVRVAKVFSSKPTIRSSAQRQSKYKQLKSLATLSILLGLHWAIGFLLIISTDLLFNQILSWCFNSIAAFQGVYTFIVCCVLREDIFKTWFPTCLCAEKKDPKNIRPARSKLEPTDNVAPPSQIQLVSEPEEVVETERVSSSTEVLPPEINLHMDTSVDTERQMKLVINELFSEILSKPNNRNNQVE